MPEFKNPNQQGGDSSNSSLLTIMLVMVAVFFGLQYVRGRRNPQTASPQATTTQTAAANKAQTASPSVITPPSAELLRNAGVTPPAPGSSAGPTAVAPAEVTTTVENELYRITFSNAAPR